MGATMNKPSNKESVQDTVARLRANRNQHQPKAGTDATHSTKERSQLNTPTRSKTSKNAKAVSAAERKTEANKIIKHLLLGELTQGQALKSLRINTGTQTGCVRKTCRCLKKNTVRYRE